MDKNKEKELIHISEHQPAIELQRYDGRIISGIWNMENGLYYGAWEDELKKGLIEIYRYIPITVEEYKKLIKSKIELREIYKKESYKITTEVIYLSEDKKEYEIKRTIEKNIPTEDVKPSKGAFLLR